MRKWKGVNRMKKELLIELEKEIAATKRIIQRVAKEIKRFPKGRLEVGVVRKKYVQFHMVENVNGKPVRSYIPKENMKLVISLAQKSYEKKLEKAAKRSCKALQRALRTLEEDNLQAVYEHESKERKQLITPLIPTDEQYIEQWYQEHPGDRNSYVKTTAYTTIRGETVRSKSEKMIADAYYMAGVPYVYEPTVILPNGRTRYPDFAVLNVRLRRTYYHEHFGMMDDEEYRQNAILRMREYNKNGFPVGEQIIVTFEGENIPFDQEELAEIIQAYLQ
ncbi:MAG: hypothetical protein J6Y10_09190 [Lachnospiraceae bacterium]|nr:hypothetical protein [Lachnospiraceae bacterium]